MIEVKLEARIQYRGATNLQHFWDKNHAHWACRVSRLKYIPDNPRYSQGEGTMLATLEIGGPEFGWVKNEYGDKRRGVALFSHDDIIERSIEVLNRCIEVSHHGGFNVDYGPDDIHIYRTDISTAYIELIKSLVDEITKDDPRVAVAFDNLKKAIEGEK